MWQKDYNIQTIKCKDKALYLIVGELISSREQYVHI